MMGPLLLVARSEARRRWPALLGLALLIGLSGAVVLAGVSGARRAASSVDRFLATSRTAEIRVDLDIGADAAGAQALFDEVARVPGVTTVIPAWACFLFVEEGTFGIAASPDPRFATELNQPRVLEGRMPSGAGEIALNETAAFAFLRVDVGDRVRGETLTVADLATMLAGDPDVPLDGPELDFQVVGIFRLPDELSSSLDVGPTGVVGLGFYERYGDELAGAHVGLVYTSGADVAEVAGRIDETLGDAEQQVVNQHAEVRAFAEGGVRVSVVGLAVFAGVALVAGALFVGQAVTR